MFARARARTCLLFLQRGFSLSSARSPSPLLPCFVHVVFACALRLKRVPHWSTNEQAESEQTHISHQLRRSSGSGGKQRL